MSAFTVGAKKKKKVKPGRFKYKHAKLTLPLLSCALPPCQSVPQERGKLIFAPLTHTNFDKSVHKNAALLPKSGKLHPPTVVSHKMIVWLKNQTHAGLVINTWLVFFFVHTDADPCWNRGQRDPEGNPGEDNQQAGGDICLQDEVENAPLQLKMEDQLRIIAFEKDVA